MKVVSSLKSHRKRDLNSKLVRRRGRIYIINKKNPKYKVRQSPLLPDNQHLHMSLYKLLLKQNKTKLRSNYTVSIYINLIYLSLIIPGIIFMDNGLFCRYYFFSLLIIYIYFYKVLYEKVK